MTRRIVCLLACLLLLPAFALAQDSFVMAGFDGEDSTHNWETNGFFTRMEARTGVTFTYEQYDSQEAWQAAKDAMFASGELPDVLFKASLSTQELIRYTDSGQIIDLAPLLETYAPNLWRLLEENPDWRAAITLPNGKIGALPAIQVPATQNALWINQTWLDRLGLEPPTDMDSLRDVLTALRDRDPNQNGRADEIPLTFLGPWELKFFSHAYGVVANDYNVYLDTDGQVRYWPDDDRFFEMAACLRDLYADGLLDENGFYTADNLRRITDDEATLTYGAFFAPTPVNLVTYEMSKQYVVVEPFVYEGGQIYRDFISPVTRGTFAITSACDSPETLLSWVDVLYTEEGAIEAMVGYEGQDYVFDAQGYWNWKGGLENMSTAVLSDLSLYDTGDMPWLFPYGFYSQYAEENVRRINTELDKLTAFVVRPFPEYTLTAQQSDDVRQLQNVLGTYVDESLARVVMGQEDLTPEGIEAFRQGLRDLGMEEMIAFWQGIADGLE